MSDQEARIAFFHSIRFKTVLVLGAAVAIVGLLDRTWIEPQLHERAISRALREQLGHATDLAANVELFMRGARAELQAAARSHDLVSMEPARIEANLMRLGQQTPFFNYFFVTDPDGVWRSYPEHPELVGRRIPDENLGWVREVAETRQTVFLEVKRSVIGTLVSGFATPILDERGAVVGILRGVFVVSARNTATELMARADLGPRGRALLVARNGWLLTHSRTPLAFERYADLDYTGRPAVRRLMRGETGAALERLGDEDWLVAQTPTETSGWGVVVERPAAEVVEQVRQDAALIRRLFLGGSLGVLLLLLLGLQLVLRPLSRLAAALAAGAPPRRVTRARDEIGVLARRFTALIEQMNASRQALVASEEKFRNIVHQSVDGLAVADGHGAVIEWNDSLTRLTGLPASAARGRPLWNLMHELLPAEERTEARREAWRRRLQEPEASEGPDEPVGSEQLEIARGDGAHRLAQLSLFPIRLEAERLTAGIFRDVTETRRLERELRHTEKMGAIGQLAGGVAHDFNNQLGGIVGYAELLCLELAENPRLVAYAEHILRGALRAAELTGQLLAFARKGKYTAVGVDVHRLIAEVVAVLFRSLDKRIVLEPRLRAEPATTLGDPTQLQSALLNLAVNARDAMPDGGRLEIATDLVALDRDQAAQLRLACEAGRYLRVSVRDEGAGMTHEVKERIFEPFFTTKPIGQGTGLGLPAVWGAVRNHQGGLAVESAPGQGTTFSLFLPLVELPAQGPEAAPPEPQARGQGRVLVVDDEPAVREVTVQMLRAAGYHVSACADARSALARLAEPGEPVDLVILDLVMPDMGGREVFEAIRARWPRLAVLLSSGFSRDGEVESLLADGAAGFLQKPYRAAELGRAVQHALAGGAAAPG
jgi:PAS domain S-box-containing protein